MVYLITFDLKTPGKDYTALHETIKNLGEWLRILETSWIVKTSLDAAEISALIRRSIGFNDYFIVCTSVY